MNAPRRRTPKPTLLIDPPIARSAVVMTLLLAAFGCFLAAAPARADDAESKPDASSPEQQAERVAFFESKIRPVLVEHCYSCHSAEADSVEGGLLLDNRASIRKGGDSGAALTPGKPSESPLLSALKYDGDLQMPPDGKLPDQVIRDFEIWIRDGAVDPRDGKALSPTEKIRRDAEQHWAYQPVERPADPQLADPWRAWSRSKLDRLIAAKLQHAEIAPSRDADRHAWLRRVTYDLTGLPPTYEDAQNFLNDASGEAAARVVDRLLASPQFGERWARHWLDLARFGDTKGYDFTKGRDYPHAHKFRDWVINSLNNDLPYDQFLRYQLAADLLIQRDDQSVLAAQGYVTLGRRFLNNIHDITDDRMDVVFRGMMGMTISCARCHDHKYDPISAKDYYAIYGVFVSSKEKQDEQWPLRLIEGSSRNVHVFVRGKPGNRGELAVRRFPEFFNLGPEKFSQGSGRRELAEAITHPDNPLTARVFVNRVWGKLFGQYLVSTPSDFGMRAERPVQLDVLDHLADEFVTDGWSVKRLIRRIALSSVYRQSSDDRAAASEQDPENQLFWRMPKRRLDFESMRDSVLAVAGRLDSKVGGESAKIATDPQATRRTLYAYIDRQNLPDLFRTFDFALPDTHAPKRPFTTTPQQSLYLMNNAFAHVNAEHLAARVADAPDRDTRIRKLYQLLLARDPDDFELRVGRQFLDHADATRRWEYGYGELDPETNKLTLTPFPHFDGTRYRGVKDFPDPELGYATLAASHGHPGVDGKAVIRRWRSPAAGVTTVRGRLKHPSDKGNGIRARLVHNGRRVVAEWTAAGSEVDTVHDGLAVQRGDTLELIVDCRGDIAFDSHHWRTQIQLQSDSGVRSWDSHADFGPDKLNVWARYAQTLLMTNEFHFLD